MTEVLPVPTIRIVSVAEQGVPGPPGNDGAGFASRMAGVFIKTPEAATVPVVPSSAYAFDLLGIRGLKVATGTLTLSVQINGIDVEGLSGLSVTSTVQAALAVGSNSVAVGDRVTLVIANVSGATDLEFTVY